jgi:hypothetical protein
MEGLEYRNPIYPPDNGLFTRIIPLEHPGPILACAEWTEGEISIIISEEHTCKCEVLSSIPTIAC